MRGWLTPKPDPDFETKCAKVCAVYVAAPDAAEQGVSTVLIDEMSGVQALERAAPSLPMKPGKIERRFSILARKLPRRGSFTSLQDLKEPMSASSPTSTEPCQSRSSGPKPASRWPPDQQNGDGISSARH
jgi:hypothetical protein